VAYEIHDGWVHGELPGPNGSIEVILFPREDMKPWTKLAKDPPNLCLHTTEGSTKLGVAYKTWEFPPNFACGDGHIVQLFPLGHASEAVDTKDGYLMQVELAYRVGPGGDGLGSATKVYLPPPSTLDPLVALVAFLDKEGLITTGLRRPNLDWPVSLDRLPAAVDTYYRRTDGTWPKAGVYGHVEIPDDEHYDPASFDYPTFFEMVRSVLEEDELTPKQEEALARMTTFLDTLTEALGKRGGDPESTDDKARAKGAAQRLAKTVLKDEKTPGT
jgi:hypothetical protein